MVPTSFKPVWNAKWKWHKRHCKNHAINNGRTSHWAFKQVFPLYRPKINISQLPYSFCTEKKKRKKEKLKRIFFWPSTNKCNVANNACVASPHCSHITAPRSLLRAENPVTTQLAGNTTGNITAKYLLICSHQTGALNRCHCYSQSQAGLGCVFVFILFCSRSQSVKVTFHKCIKHHNIPASSGVYYELSKAWCSLSLFFFFKLHLSRR